MTQTAAYNANEVAAVYMSLNRNDLLSTDEGGNLGSDGSLKNGFYGLSDPLNLRGVLESFEANFERSKNSSSYKVRILNPTAELETLLMGFYDNVFPSTTSVFKEFKTAAEKEKRMLSVSAATGDGDTAFLKVNEVPSLPRLYLRFGYGTNSREGLSRIHKAVVSDIKYTVSDKKDKVIELACTDLYTFNRLNPTFNRRPYISKVSVLDKALDKKSGERNLSLRKPSHILSELFAKYTAAYPMCIPVVDLGEYIDKIDHLTYSVAFALAEGDAISKKEAEEKDEEPKDFSSVPAKALTEDQLALVQKAINQPLTSKKALDRKANGVVTQQILFQAYKMMFEQIGLSWEVQEKGDTKEVTGPAAQNQTTPIQQPNSISDKDATSQKVNDANNSLWEDTTVNIQWDLLRDGKYLPHISNLSEQETFGLSFWPMGYRASGDPVESVDLSGNTIISYPGTPIIRPLTEDERRAAIATGNAPLWVDAGIVNSDNYEMRKYKYDNKQLKYEFTLGELRNRWYPAAHRLGRRMNDEWSADSRTTLVSIPVMSPATAPETFLLKGPQDNTSEITGTNCVPLVDIDNNYELMSAESYPRLPEGDIKEWAHYASGVIMAASHPETAPYTPGAADNPPLISLHPGPSTVRFLNFATASYSAFIQKENEEKRKAQEKAVEEAARARRSELTKQVINVEPSEDWLEEVERMSNAYVYMGDSNESPHISAFLEKIINNLNRVIIGNNSKLMVQPLQANALSPGDKKIISEIVPAFKDYDWQDERLQKDPTFLIVGTESDISKWYGEPLVREIFSFPQLKQQKILDTGITDFDAAEFENQIIWLDYGTPDSIIAKFDFEGDTRVMLNLAQSNFAVRQFNDINKLFAPEDLSKEMITNVISRGLENKISQIVIENSNVELTEEEKDILAKEKAELERQRDLVKKTAESSEALIDSELLEIFPEMVKSFETDEDLSEVVGKKSARDMQVLASLVSNPHTLNWLFPEEQIDGNTNKKTGQYIEVTPDGITKIDVTVPILQRKVDFSQMYSRVNEIQQQFKLTDAKHSYIAAMQQEVFKIRLTTLGLPEIDNPAQEFLSRYFFIKFYDPRLANGTLHWLSGVYKLNGFKHVINPSQGFLTQLSLYKLPGSAGDIQTARDIR